MSDKYCSINKYIDCYNFLKMVRNWIVTKRGDVFYQDLSLWVVIFEKDDEHRRTHTKEYLNRRRYCPRGFPKGGRRRLLHLQWTPKSGRCPVSLGTCCEVRPLRTLRTISSSREAGRDTRINSKTTAEDTASERLSPGSDWPKSHINSKSYKKWKIKQRFSKCYADPDEGIVNVQYWVRVKDLTSAEIPLHVQPGR